jgi:hypothetical protein
MMGSAALGFADTQTTQVRFRLPPLRALLPHSSTPERLQDRL